MGIVVAGRYAGERAGRRGRATRTGARGLRSHRRCSVLCLLLNLLHEASPCRRARPVVWYLMTPPIVGQGSHRNVRNHALLRKWERASNFDSEEACNQRIRDVKAVKGRFDNFN